MHCVRFHPSKFNLHLSQRLHDGHEKCCTVLSFVFFFVLIFLLIYKLQSYDWNWLKQFCEWLWLVFVYVARTFSLLWNVPGHGCDSITNDLIPKAKFSISQTCALHDLQFWGLNFCIAYKEKLLNFAFGISHLDSLLAT